MLALIQDPEVPDQAGADFGNTSQVHPIGLAALIALATLALLAPRRWSTMPLILLLCFIPAGQRVVIATVDFTFLRLLMVVIWGRILIRREVQPIVWNHLDRLMVLWAGTLVVTGTLLTMTLTGVINRAGTAVDSMMVYFFFRLLIRTPEDLIRIAVQFMVSAFAVLAFFVVENRTHRNMFGVFGGVPEITDVRDGRLRCQGAFAHSILAGCFWACLIPFFFARGWLGRGWLLPAGASAAAVAIVGLCASSTPVMALAFGIAGGCAFLVRNALRWYLLLGVGWLMVLHFFLMKMPVWHLLARVDIVGGSTGWHRYHLVDKFFERFHEWWMVGTLRTGHWGPGLHDVTNQFVAEGVSGGLIRLALFAAAILMAFAGVSRSLRLPGQLPSQRFIAWAIGTAMFMHCMNFIAVSYFEQIVVLWQLTLAAAASLTLVPGAAVARQLRGLRTALA